MTASELQDMLVRTLARQGGGTQRQWRLVLGPVRLYDAATHPHCNWSFDPSGDARENGEVERLLDKVRLSHPIARKD
jgi:hypothetical protein